MDWAVTPYIVPLVASVMVSLFLLWYIIRRAESAGARYMGWFMIGQITWGLTYLVQLTAQNPDLVLLVDRLLLPLVPLTVVSWFLFALEYADYSDWHRTGMLVFVFGVPVVTWILVPTNSYHWWFWSSYEVTRVNGLVLPDSPPVLWYWVHAIHSYILIVLSIALIIRRTLNTWSIYRMQSVVMVSAALIPLAANIAYQLGYTVIDFSSIALGVGAAGFTWGLYRYELFDLVPVARDTVIDEMREAMIVIDQNGKILDINDAATDILPLDEDVVGREAEAVLPFELLETDGGRSPTGHNVTLTDGGTESHYRLNTTPLQTDSKGDKFGRILVLQDITELKQRERQLERTNEDLAQTNEELEILHRIVRHDIQNDMNVVKGHAQLVETLLDEEDQDAIEPVLHNTNHAIELTETVRDLIESLSGDAELDLGTVDLVALIRSELKKARAAYDDATFQFELPEDVTAGQPVPVRANEMLSSVVHNLLSNAVRHNDTDEPEVTISFDIDEAAGTVTLRVADNGPGVPDDKKTEIFGRGEKGLDSPGTGVGLYLVDSLATQFGGDVHIEDNEPRGAVFVVELVHGDADD